MNENNVTDDPRKNLLGDLATLLLEFKRTEFGFVPGLPTRPMR